MEEKPDYDPETTAREELKQCELRIAKTKPVLANLGVDWHMISCYKDKIENDVKLEFQAKQILHMAALEKGCKVKRPMEKKFWDKVYNEDTEGLKLQYKQENIEWADLVSKKVCELFEIKLFVSHFQLYGYMKSKTEEFPEVYLWEVDTGAVGWYHDEQGIERYVIMEQMEVLEADLPEFWQKHPDAYGKYLHQCLVCARLLQLHLNLNYLPHILIVPVSGTTGQSLYPGLFFDYPVKCKEVLESFEWTALKPFSSRCLADFQFQKFLSKGGFGEVFQAKHKVDKCSYAIKMIGPLCDEDLEVINREVIALANLEHPGIVRYYNAWFEAPPSGWKYEIDNSHLQHGTSSYESSSEPLSTDLEPEADELTGGSLEQEIHFLSVSEVLEQPRQSGKSPRFYELDMSTCLDSGVITEDTENKWMWQNKQCKADGTSAPLYLFIQMQLCKQETLAKWLADNQNRKHAFCLHIFEQILCAVEYFHGKGLMHRDLKPSNIFFSPDGSVKVGDFGLATAYTSDNDMNMLAKDDNNLTAHVGTKLYMSPEQIEDKAYSLKVDIFALGLIFFELFYPIGTDMEKAKVLSDIKCCVFPEGFKEKMPAQTELINWLLSTTPEERPSATEIINGDILRKVRRDVLEENQE